MSRNRLGWARVAARVRTGGPWTIPWTIGSELSGPATALVQSDGEQLEESGAVA